jgi:hypothetical protein
VESEQKLLGGLNEAYVSLTNIGGDLQEVEVELGISAVNVTLFTDTVRQFLFLS